MKGLSLLPVVCLVGLSGCGTEHKPPTACSIVEASDEGCVLYHIDSNSTFYAVDPNAPFNFSLTTKSFIQNSLSYCVHVTVDGQKIEDYCTYNPDDGEYKFWSEVLKQEEKRRKKMKGTS